ncbi:Origin recognition complex subunit 3 [Nakaseomyces bracarensis]|uniref:Origin recognition complex subunit 3 n=1 Tax=Nakaseomyces bracarensis TaxID=273131 RepID=A0ABR4NQE1_9SACH
MSVSEFADSQRTHYIARPKYNYDDFRRDENELNTPFVRLLDGNEQDIAILKRWDLYHSLYSNFHDKVDDIVNNIATDLIQEVMNVLRDVPGKEYNYGKPCFNTLFLLGSDSSLNVELPNNDPKVLDVVIELTPKESPNVRMMLRRSMFKLVQTADNCLSSKGSAIKMEDKGSLGDEDSEINLEIASDKITYDLTLLENFYDLFGKELNLVFNFKDVDSMGAVILDDFVELLNTALKNEHVKISLIFNINTNLSNFAKNFRQSTIRLLRRKYHKIDVSSNKGYKYGNRIFQSFLDTVDGKLNLSDRFVEFLMEKMSNNSNHNLQLMVKILDYALMSYFFENPFSVYIDPVNIDYLDQHYLNKLVKCPTFMFFVEGLIKENTSSTEILSLLDNTDNSLVNFFVEFLVRENPINGHAKYVATFLEDELGIKNYNLIELYYNMLQGKLGQYLSRWPACRDHIAKLDFEPIDTLFQELFTLDHSNGSLSQALFPLYRTNVENNLLNWEQVMPVNEASPSKLASLNKLNETTSPIVCHLFKLYREANQQINTYDFYTVFKETLPEEEIMNYIEDVSKEDEKLAEILNKPDAFEKIALILFMQALFDFELIGIIKPAGKGYDILEKCIWRGL